jgi:hypothetical protein
VIVVYTCWIKLPVKIVPDIEVVIFAEEERIAVVSQHVIDIACPMCELSVPTQKREFPFDLV